MSAQYIRPASEGRYQSLEQFVSLEKQSLSKICILFVSSPESTELQYSDDSHGNLE